VPATPPLSDIIPGIANASFPALPASLQSLDDLASSLSSLSSLKHAFDDSYERAFLSAQYFSHTVLHIKEKIAQYAEKKSEYVTKLRGYLSLKTNTKAEKLFEKDKKMKTRKVICEMMRFDLDMMIRTLNIQKELSVLRPLSALLSAHSVYHQKAAALLTPLEKKVRELTEYCNEHEREIKKIETDYRAKRRVWENAMGGPNRNVSMSGAALTAGLGMDGDSAPAPAASAALSGIRDLDPTFRAQQATKATEKSGILFVPVPDFIGVFATISGSKLQISRMDTFGVAEPGVAPPALLAASSGEGHNTGASSFHFPLSIDLLLCTVKENRDLKLRYVFSVISPSLPETLHLQADSQSECNDWMNVIQNAIGSALNAQKGGGNAAGSGASSAARSASPSGGSGNANYFTPDAAPVDKVEVLRRLRGISGNSNCADCDARDPEWMSLNLGILFCMECSGVHRSLGVHISKVRSATLDMLDGYLLRYFAAIGNANARSVWEAALLKNAGRGRPNAASNQQMREMWIRGKYELKSFLGAVEKNKKRLQELLFEAIQNDAVLDVYRLLAWGADANAASDAQEGRAPLHHAVLYGNVILVEALIQFGARLNEKELRGWTPLHYASYQNDPNLVELLLLRGGTALVAERDQDALTPLETVMQYNAPQDCATVRAILEQAEKVHASKGNRS
jgi:hypothetical protein